LRAVLGPTATGARVSLAMPTAEELLADILSLHVQDDEASPVLAVDRLGAGYRSLLRLAILRTYADLSEQTRPGVFLIEEPEAYLNPHLRRFFATTLNKLAARGNDVLLTTHDPAFVSIADYRSVIRVAKHEGRSVVYRCTARLDFSYERVAAKLRRAGNAEVLFAQKAILCEGQDDAAATRALLDRLGIDPDSRSISVVDCGSRDNLPDYVTLLDELHIEPLVITDGDATTIKTKTDGTAKKVKAVEDAAAGRMFRFTDDIETALGTTKRGRDNTAHLVGLIEALDLDALPEEHEIVKLTEKLRQFCGPVIPDPSAADAEPAKPGPAAPASSASSAPAG
jgi:predicted ATP-dependent endonuclease of OLD family